MFRHRSFYDNTWVFLISSFLQEILFRFSSVASFLYARVVGALIRSFLHFCSSFRNNREKQQNVRCQYWCRNFWIFFLLVKNTRTDTRIAQNAQFNYNTSKHLYAHKRFSLANRFINFPHLRREIRLSFYVFISYKYSVIGKTFDWYFLSKEMCFFLFLRS